MEPMEERLPGTGASSDDVHSTAVRAGKRTYFFDVKRARAGDLYLTITESKRGGDGLPYERHKLFLYKEDFDSFLQGLGEAVRFARTEGEVNGGEKPV